jgi:hypothetical protein
MKKWMIGVAVLLLAMPAVAHEAVRTIERTVEIDAEQILRLDVSVAELAIEGVDGEEVQIRVAIGCSHSSRRCRDRAEEMELDVDSRARSLEIALRGHGKRGNDLEIDVEIGVPRQNSFELDMGVGEVKIRGMEGDVGIELGVGNVKIRYAEDKVHSVDLEVGVGEADLRPHQRRASSSGFLFLGNEVDWDDGPGNGDIEVEVGVGDVDVIIE